MPLRRALGAVLIGIAALWAMPSSAQLYVDQTVNSLDPTGVVGEYNATTGAPINADFISGLNFPFGLALSGNTLFVANSASNTVGAYDATTGAPINASLITGLRDPYGLAASGNTLFVANIANPTEPIGTVGEYDATTGAPINANFITGLTGPFGLAVASPVPEASPWWMMAGGSVALLGIMLRKKRRTA
jgi:hypothetical protein